MKLPLSPRSFHLWAVSWSLGSCLLAQSHSPVVGGLSSPCWGLSLVDHQVSQWESCNCFSATACRRAGFERSVGVCQTSSVEGNVCIHPWFQMRMNHPPVCTRLKESSFKIIPMSHFHILWDSLNLYIFLSWEQFFVALGWLCTSANTEALDMALL